MSVGRSEVLGLYRRLLRLHQQLPGDFGSIGRRFVQQEFKSHKDVSAEHAKQFVREWTSFANMLDSQLDKIPPSTGDKNTLGHTLSSKDLELFNEQQLLQLFELSKETRKAVDPTSIS